MLHFFLQRTEYRKRYLLMYLQATRMLLIFTKNCVCWITYLSLPNIFVFTETNCAVLTVYYLNSFQSTCSVFPQTTWRWKVAYFAKLHHRPEIPCLLVFLKRNELTVVPLPTRTQEGNMKNHENFSRKWSYSSTHFIETRFIYWLFCTQGKSPS